MKRTILTILLLTAILTTINGMQFCGLKKGLYIDVKTSVYKLYEPMDRLTNGYIQIDSNEDFIEPDFIKVNREMVDACTKDMQADADLLCD